jgi:hypothetical protein
MRHAASLDKTGQLKQCDEAWKLPIKKHMAWIRQYYGEEKHNRNTYQVMYVCWCVDIERPGPGSIHPYP